MFHLARIINLRITSNWLDLRFTQLICVFTALGLMYFAMRAVAHFASTPGEAILGVLLAVTAPLLFIVIGLLLPLVIKSAASPVE